jgi:hypothetical protein
MSSSSSSSFTTGSRWYVYLTSILPIIFGLLMVGIGTYFLISGKAIIFPPPNSTKADVATIVDFSCGSTSDATYPCQVTVSYVVHVGTDGPRTFTTGTNNHYRVGENVILYVSNSDPTQITQFDKKTSSINPWILVGFGSLSLVLVIGNNWLVSRSSTVANVEGGLAAFRMAEKLRL